MGPIPHEHFELHVIEPTAGLAALEALRDGRIDRIPTGNE
jgi:hypothetical protein